MVVSLNTAQPNPESYRNFIDSLRRAVAGENYEEGKIIVTPRALVSNDNRFTEVELTNSKGKTIKVAIDVTNLYVVAYTFEKDCWFLRDKDYHPNDPPGSMIFSDINWRHVLNFGGRYGGARQLESFAGNRRKIDLGMAMLDEAIELLSKGSQAEDIERASSFLVVIQMIPEAAKFRYVEQLVVNSIQENRPFVPDDYMITLEDNWEGLSEQIQRDGGENLPDQVQIRDAQDDSSNASTTSTVNVSDLAIIKLYSEDVHDG